MCPAAGTDQERDGGRSPRVDGRGRLTGRSEHSRNGYDRTVTAAATRALEVVTRAGVDHRVHPYALPERHGRERDERPNYGLEAAAALGVEPARVFKTLVASSTARLVLAVVPVDRELDLKRLATRAGGRRAVDGGPGRGRTGDRLRRRRDQPAGLPAGAAGRRGRLARRARDGLRLGRPARAPARARPRPTWCVWRSATSARIARDDAAGLTDDRRRLAYSARSQASTDRQG